MGFVANDRTKECISKSCYKLCTVIMSLLS